MKRFQSIALASALVLAVGAGVGQVATAASSAATHTATHGKIGKQLPSSGAAARIRALGLDGEGGGDSRSSDDSGGLVAGGHVSHGSIGSLAPGANAAAQIRALGLDE
jgi:hypothetical protein